MTQKRNNQRRAELDLADIVEAAQIETRTTDDFRRIRRAMEMLLKRDVLGPMRTDARLVRKIRSLSLATIDAWQGGVLFLLYSTVLDKEATIPKVGVGATMQFRSVKLSPRVGEDGEVRIYVIGSLQEALLLQLAGLLHASGAHRLMRCECNRIFVKTGRREFCSDRCQKRVYMRAVRKGAASGKAARAR